MADATLEAPPTPKGNYALLHELTWPEVLSAKRSVSNRSGYLVAGPDRRGANALAQPHLWRMWQHDVQAAETVPPAVADYFARTKHLAAPPKEGVALEVYGSNPPMNAEPLRFDENEFRVSDPLPKEGTTPMLDLLELTPDATGTFAVPASTKKHPNPPRFTCSYSQMQAYLNCPKKWAAEKYYKTLKWVESEAQRQGNVAHKILENYLKGLPLTAEQQKLLEPWKKYPDAMLRTVAAGAKIRVEHEICFQKDMTPCGWWDNNKVWFRSKSDVFIVKDRKLSYFDWKHGKTKPDTFQIKVALACADLDFGDEWDTADGKLIFLKEKDPKQAAQGLDKPITKADIPAIWDEIFAITSMMEKSWADEVFQARSSGLCRNYCGNKECPHCG